MSYILYQGRDEWTFDDWLEFERYKEPDAREQSITAGRIPATQFDPSKHEGFALADDSDGCSFCGSVFHRIGDCPDNF